MQKSTFPLNFSPQLGDTLIFFFPFKLIQPWLSGNHMSPNKQDCAVPIEMII